MISNRKRNSFYNKLKKRIRKIDYNNGIIPKEEIWEVGVALNRITNDNYEILINPELKESLKEIKIKTEKYRREDIDVILDFLNKHIYNI